MVLPNLKMAQFKSLKVAAVITDNDDRSNKSTVLGVVRLYQRDKGRWKNRYSRESHGAPHHGILVLLMPKNLSSVTVIVENTGSGAAAALPLAKPVVTIRR